MNMTTTKDHKKLNSQGLEMACLLVNLVIIIMSAEENEAIHA
jgi:hypothetical protein